MKVLPECVFATTEPWWDRIPDPCDCGEHRLCRALLGNKLVGMIRVINELAIEARHLGEPNQFRRFPDRGHFEATLLLVTSPLQVNHQGIRALANRHTLGVQPSDGLVDH